SEGGLVAPIAATTSPDVAFIVLMAGTGLPGDQIVQLQSRLIETAQGVAEEGLEESLKLHDELVEIAKTEADPEVAKTRMKEALDAAKEKMTPEQREALESQSGLIDARIAALRSPWFRYFLSFDPRPTLRKVQCPVLAIVGEKDLQVPPKENLSAIKEALEAGGNTAFTVKELPGLNHLFQTAKTGSTAEYATIEETISPDALQVIGDWVVEQGMKE
ncbi:MAG: alpha/beta hydrolase, partial [Isosphaeraceae bacterium]